VTLWEYLAPLFLPLPLCRRGGSWRQVATGVASPERPPEAQLLAPEPRGGARGLAGRPAQEFQVPRRCHVTPREPLRCLRAHSCRWL
jgi:hypothetical protein